MPTARVGCFQIIHWNDKDREAPDNPRDPAGLQYIASVRKELVNIAHSQAGRALIDSIFYHKKTITIMPSPENVCNAAEEKSGTDGSLILFSPDDLRKCSAELGPNDRSATLPHERLHHELVHSLRRISGKINPFPINGQRLSAFGQNEEFLAIVMTNIFISDVSNKHRTSLRGAWGNHPKLEEEFAESFRFFSLDPGVYNLLWSFCSDNRGYANLLSYVNAPFNPVAAILRDSRKCFEISAMAMDREAFDEMYWDHVKKGMKPLGTPPSGT